MRIIIHIKLVEEYPRYYYKDINKMLTKHFRRVNKDTFELKKGVFLKFDRDELLIYEEEKEEPSSQNGG